jgi:hypothetical protein
MFLIYVYDRVRTKTLTILYWYAAQKCYQYQSIVYESYMFWDNKYVICRKICKHLKYSLKLSMILPSVHVSFRIAISSRRHWKLMRVGLAYLMNYNFSGNKMRNSKCVSTWIAWNISPAEFGGTLKCCL